MAYMKQLREAQEGAIARSSSLLPISISVVNPLDLIQISILEGIRTCRCGGCCEDSL